jgi:DNA transformation protein and related proteins
MAISEQFLEYILEQLQGLGRLTSRRMFSGAGLYSDGLFFGLLYKDRLYFKTDDSTRPEYEARGSEGFRPRPNTARLKATYYTVPAEVLEDSQELVTWARKAVAVSLASENAKPARKAAGEGGRRTKGTRTRGRRDNATRNNGIRDSGPHKPKSKAAPATRRMATKKRAKPTR